MANVIEYADCFHYTTTELALRYGTAGTGLTVGVYGRLGARGVRNNTESTTRTLVALSRTLISRATHVVGFAYNPYNGLPAGNRVIGTFKEGSTCHLTFVLTAAGTIEVRRGTGAGTVLGTTSALPVGVIFTHIETKVTISDTVGVVQIWFNGTGDGTTNRVLNLSSVDTQNGGTSVADSWQFFNDVDAGVASPYAYIGDFHVNDDTQVGDTFYEDLDPNANGDISQMLGSDGNNTDNYLLVAKSSPNMTTYLDEATAGEFDLHNFESLSISSATIKAVVVETYDQKTDAGTCTAAHRIKSGATSADGATYSPSTSVSYNQTIWQTDPDTAAAFTVSGVNALQAGPKRIS